MRIPKLTKASIERRYPLEKDWALMGNVKDEAMASVEESEIISGAIARAKRTIRSSDPGKAACIRVVFYFRGESE